MTSDRVSVSQSARSRGARAHIISLTQCRSTADGYSTLEERGRRNTLDNTLEPADKDGVPVRPCSSSAAHDGTFYLGMNETQV